MQHVPLDAIISQYDLSTLPLIDSAIDQCLHHYYATLDEANFSISNQNAFLAFSSPPKILNTITGVLYLILTRRVEDFRQSRQKWYFVFKKFCRQSSHIQYFGQMKNYDPLKGDFQILSEISQAVRAQDLLQVYDEKKMKFGCPVAQTCGLWVINVLKIWNMQLKKHKILGHTPHQTTP